RNWEGAGSLNGLGRRTLGLGDFVGGTAAFWHHCVHATLFCTASLGGGLRGLWGMWSFRRRSRRGLLLDH
ncbi:MAG: hypothetical protein OXI33_11870, partial [Chloroflexota bacterium]|nr:hypothetical protein [Chloroflexota bacterium]